jgi:hypothetical protein
VAVRGWWNLPTPCRGIRTRVSTVPIRPAVRLSNRVTASYDRLVSRYDRSVRTSSEVGHRRRWFSDHPELPILVQLMKARRLAVSLVVLAAVAASCTGGSSGAASHNHTTRTQVSASSPADNGGYAGHAARVFDTAYRTCYLSVAKTHGILPTGLNSPGANQPTARLSGVADDGCNAGLQQWGKAHGIQVAKVLTITLKSSP